MALLQPAGSEEAEPHQLCLFEFRSGLANMGPGCCRSAAQDYFEILIALILTSFT